MNHPLDKKESKAKYKEYDPYQMVCGFKQDRGVRKYVYMRDRYGAKQKRQEKQAEEFRMINSEKHEHKYI